MSGGVYLRAVEAEIAGLLAISAATAAAAPPPPPGG